MFNTDSEVANAWAREIKRGGKTIEDVPKLSNLIEVVAKIIKGVVEDV